MPKFVVRIYFFIGVYSCSPASHCELARQPSPPRHSPEAQPMADGPDCHCELARQPSKARRPGAKTDRQGEAAWATLKCKNYYHSHLVKHMYNTSYSLGSLRRGGRVRGFI